MKISKEVVIAYTKEILRIAILGAVSAVLAYVGTVVANLDPTSVYAVVLTALLRAADKAIHDDKKTKANGLLPF